MNQHFICIGTYFTLLRCVPYIEFCEQRKYFGDQVLLAKKPKRGGGRESLCASVVVCRVQLWGITRAEDGDPFSNALHPVSLELKNNFIPSSTFTWQLLCLYLPSNIIYLNDTVTYIILTKFLPICPPHLFYREI